MRVLMVHNYYQQAGGEDQSYEAEAELLELHGHEVVRYTRHNDEITRLGTLRTALDTVWSERARVDLRRLLDQHAPEIAHFQNTFPLISPSAYWLMKSRGIPVVQSIRNYRLICLNALLFRGGGPCEDCVGKAIPWPGVIHRCYRRSRSASGVVASMQILHRGLGTWKNKVDMFIANTEFARAKLVKGGIPASRITVKPNFLQVDPGRRTGVGDYALFVGRLTKAKGIGTLIDAWQLLDGIPLRIVGGGALESTAQSLRAPIRDSIEFIGSLSHAETINQLRGARCLIFPSLIYETFGRVLIEAFACGVPVIASRLGAASEIVDDGRTGILFQAGSAQQLAKAISWAWDHPAEMAEMGKRGRGEYELKYTAERNYETLAGVYERAMSRQIQP